MQVSKPHKSAILKKLGFIGVCIALGWYLKGKTIPSGQMAGMGQNAPYVLVEKIVKEDTTQGKDYISHVEAINSVNLLAEVSGTVEQILFKEGSFVKEGDLLFVIDQEKYKATKNLREAELNRAKAVLAEAEKNYNRQVKLSKQNIASKATFDAAQSAYLQAQSNVKQAEANLDLASIDFEKTTVKSPINGYIGKALVTKGNYVKASDQTLAKIVQISPVRVTFTLTDKEFLQIKNKYADLSHADIQAKIKLPDGEVLLENFAALFVNNEISTDTATISVYADFENKDEKLLPGNYVRLSLIGDVEKNMTVSQASLAQDENGFYTFVIKDNVAEERRLVLGDVFGSRQIVKDGLEEGETVVIQGLQKISDGMPVKAALVQTTQN